MNELEQIKKLHKTIINRLKRDKYYKNVTISEDWKNFKIFYKEIKEIENFDKWLKNPSKWNLDKDLKNKKGEKKQYSKENCIFLTERKNKSLSNGTGKKIFVYNFDGEKINEFETIIEAEEYYNILASYISRVCKKNMKQYKNLIFTYEDESLEEIKKRFEKIELTQQIFLLEYDNDILIKKTRLSDFENKNFKKAIIYVLTGKLKTTKYLTKDIKISFCKLINKNKIKITEELKCHSATSSIMKSYST